VLEERERLARELHDSVTQSLYAVSLHAEAATRALTEGEPVASERSPLGTAAAVD
jgi:signal transduction histidine kinase